MSLGSVKQDSSILCSLLCILKAFLEFAIHNTYLTFCHVNSTHLLLYIWLLIFIQYFYWKHFLSQKQLPFHLFLASISQILLYKPEAPWYLPGIWVPQWCVWFIGLTHKSAHWTLIHALPLSLPLPFQISARKWQGQPWRPHDEDSRTFVSLGAPGWRAALENWKRLPWAVL